MVLYISVNWLVWVLQWPGCVCVFQWTGWFGRKVDWVFFSRISMDFVDLDVSVNRMALGISGKCVV